MPVQLILGGAMASDEAKNQRLFEQIRLAEEGGYLTAALGFLESVPDSHWEKRASNAVFSENFRDG